MDFRSRGNFRPSFLQISASGRRLCVADYFTMLMWWPNIDRLDLRIRWAMVFTRMTHASGKNRALSVGAGKDRNIYLANRDALGCSPRKETKTSSRSLQPLKGIRYRGAPACFDSRFIAHGRRRHSRIPVWRAQLVETPFPAPPQNSSTRRHTEHLGRWVQNGIFFGR